MKDLMGILKVSLHSFASVKGKPYIVLIHPSITVDLPESLNGTQIYRPSYAELERISFFMGSTIPEDSKEFWNPEHAFILDRDAWERVTSPAKGIGKTEE